MELVVSLLYVQDALRTGSAEQPMHIPASNSDV